ncbi:uncharacterized protein LOC116110047 [Pistacia vera]|uniref:uncharacterized protein LOC116110047 n=1 Tax=Pistacia vera TaxID=55513 RepID=UPI00126360B8|nr:uncharacterized protein LOC116110047 [Pistacia vera]
MDESLQSYIDRFHRELDKKYLRIENSLAALRRRNPDASGSAPGRGDSRRADRRGDADDQRRGKKPCYEPKKSYAPVPRRDRDRNQYTALNASVSAILNKSEEANLLGEPKPMKTPTTTRNNKKYYCFHRENGQHTDECRALKQAIENLIKQGHFKKYIDDSAPSQEKNQGEPSKKRHDQKGVCTLNLIFGGPHFAGNSRGAQERYAREAHHEPIRTISMAHRPQKVHREEEISFSEKDATWLHHPHDDALVIMPLIGRHNI